MPIRNPSKDVLKKLDKLFLSLIERSGIEIKPQVSLTCGWYLRPVEIDLLGRKYSEGIRAWVRLEHSRRR